MAIPLREKLQTLVQNLSIFPSKFPSKKSSRANVGRSIGLNIGKASIVGCEVSRHGDQLTLERCGRAEISPDEPVADQVKKFCAHIGFEAKEVNVSIKGHGVVIRFLIFPKMTAEEFASSIQFEAEKYLPFNISEVVLDYHINEQSSRADENSMEVILVASKRTEIEKLVKATAPTELTVNAVDLDIFACVNALEYAVPEMKEQVMGLIDFGAADTTLCICDKGVITFSRDIAFGGNDLTELLRRKLNVSLAEAQRIQHQARLPEGEQRIAAQAALDRLFQELKLSLNYFYNQHPHVGELSCFYIAGGFSQFSVLNDLLPNRIEIPVKRWDPTAKMSLGSTLNRQALDPLVPYLPVATGLALRPG